jgi:1-acyl-sn-glycerol-3-phosphate acyltransferase
MYLIIKTLVKIFYGLIYRIEITGLENIPPNEGIIIAPNHIHYADPLIVGSYYPGFINVMAKKQLFKNRLLAKIITIMGAFPVDRDGNDIRAIKESLKILKAKMPLLIFPEGTRNKLPGKSHGDGKAGIPLIAIKSKVKIVPVTIDSSFKIFSKVRIIYHEPVSLQEYEGTKLTQEEYTSIINKILDIIYKDVELR